MDEHPAIRVPMTILVEYTCDECGHAMEWLYDEEEDRIEANDTVGCPGSGCTVVHRLFVTDVDEDRATQVRHRHH